MKKLLWYISMAIIFFNMVVAIAFPDYPVVDNVLTNLCVVAALFMLYVFFFEKKTSTVVSTLTLVFGLSGITKLVFDFISMNSFLANLVLVSITGLALLIVFLPVALNKLIRQ
jgi:hypothetical protein